MSSTTHYDAVVIGSGQSGSPLAGAYAKAGKKVALIESEHVGGCCINEGCTPTKTMVASGRVAYLAKRAADYGVDLAKSEPIKVDMQRVRQRKRDIVESFRAGSERRVVQAGVDLHYGLASFKDQHTLSVKKKGSDETFAVAAEQIFINCGARPSKPKLDGIQDIDPAIILDSTSVQELGAVPEHLLVLGGGYIGLEFGQLFRRLGSEVTVIQRGPQLLPREDPEIVEALMNILDQDGIKVIREASTQNITPDGKGLKLHYKKADGKTATIAGSHLLQAAGRTPNSDTLNLDAAGVKTDSRGYITVDQSLQTSVPHIYALGDIKGGPAFTHVSYDDFRIIDANILNAKTQQKRSLDDRLISYVCYTDPQLGHVGLHESEAIKKYSKEEIQVAKMPMNYVARALETDEARGLMKAIVHRQSSKILGFTCLGLEGGEIMSIVMTAMLGGLPYQQLQNAIFAHPSLAESLNNLWSFLE